MVSRQHEITVPFFHYSIIPIFQLFQYSNIPIFQYSIIPLSHHSPSHHQTNHDDFSKPYPGVSQAETVRIHRRFTERQGLQPDALQGVC